MKASTVEKAVDTFELISKTSARTEKKRLLLGLQDNKAAKRMVLLAMGADQFYVKPPKLSDVTKVKCTKVEDLSCAWDNFEELIGNLLSGVIKGNSSRDAVNEFLYSVRNFKIAQKWFHAVLEKKLRMGVDTSIQEVWPGLIIPFGCAKGIALIEQKTGKKVPRAEKMIDFNDIVFSQPKKDGFNVTFKCRRNGTGTAVSSDNMELPVLKPWADIISNEVKHIVRVTGKEDLYNADVIEVNGEVEAVFHPDKDGDKWKSGWGKTSALVKLGIKKTGYDESTISEDQWKMLEKDLRITLYDCYPEIAHIQEVPLEYKRRYSKCRAVVNNIKDILESSNKKQTYTLRARCINLIPSVPCKNQKELDACHKRWLSEGEEGSIVRMNSTPVKADSKWRGNYVKWKEHSKFDAVIVGVEEGNGRNAGRGGAFVTYIPATKKFTNITVPNDLARKEVWKIKDQVAGWYIEAVQQADTKTGNAATFPTMSRFRHDQVPMSLKEVQKIIDSSKGKVKIVIGNKQANGKAIMPLANACNSEAK